MPLRRYMYGETLGKWRSADLLIGLAYLARKDAAEHPVADIAKLGLPAGLGLPLSQRLMLVVSTSACSGVPLPAPAGRRRKENRGRGEG